MLYVGLELSSIPLYVLAGYDKGRSKSGEASFKFLAAAGVSSAVFLFGVSWIYGGAGSVNYETLHHFLSPGVHVSGRVTIGEDVFIGTGAVIVERLTIGKGAIIGAGAVVTKNVEPGVTAVGVPARPLEKPS